MILAAWVLYSIRLAAASASTVAARPGAPPCGGSGGAGAAPALAVWWIKLGIRPVRIMAGKPQQNGRHERVHRTFSQKTEAAGRQLAVPATALRRPPRILQPQAAARGWDKRGQRRCRDPTARPPSAASDQQSCGLDGDRCRDPPNPRRDAAPRLRPRSSFRRGTLAYITRLPTCATPSPSRAAEIPARRS